MNGLPDPLLRTLDLSRLVRLYGRLCLSRFTVEMAFIVGTRRGAKYPVFHLETLNVVFEASEKMGG